MLKGSGRVKLDDEIIELKQWDALRVPGAVMRALEAGPEGLEVMAVGAPPANDTEMVQGWWTD